MTDQQWTVSKEDYRRKWVDLETQTVIHQLEMLSAGLASRRAGLIWFHPLCHDAYGENL